MKKMDWFNVFCFERFCLFFAVGFPTKQRLVCQKNKFKLVVGEFCDQHVVVWI